MSDEQQHTRVPLGRRTDLLVVVDGALVWESSAHELDEDQLREVAEYWNRRLDLERLGREASQLEEANRRSNSEYRIDPSYVVGILKSVLCGGSERGRS